MPPEWPPRGAATTAGGVSGYCHWWLQLPLLASATTTDTTKHYVHIRANYLSGLLFITAKIWLGELLARPSTSQAGKSLTGPITYQAYTVLFMDGEISSGLFFITNYFSNSDIISHSNSISNSISISDSNSIAISNNYPTIPHMRTASGQTPESRGVRLSAKCWRYWFVGCKCSVQHVL